MEVEQYPFGGPEGVAQQGLNGLPDVVLILPPDEGPVALMTVVPFL